MDLYAYTRVSTIKQLEGKGLEVQKEEIKRYCKAHNHKIRHWYSDKGVSAFKLRPDFEKMMNKVSEVDGIIVSDLSRFGRDMKDLIIQIYSLKDREKEFISVKENLDLSTETGELMLVLLSWVAKREARVIRDRLEAGKEYAKLHGTKSGKPMHRPRIDINWVYVDKWLDKGISLSKIAIMYSEEIEKISAATLYNRYNERMGLKNE